MICENVFKKSKKKFVGMKKNRTFAISKRRESSLRKRFGSSVWLEYMPVTHGVASSSLVRTAGSSQENEGFFCADTQRVV